ncbi:MAG: hypothetical protein AMJ42_06170 [Deltaproteobacteria bacterium DG_8]|nr:MAG: hypothetical protein AMJ42_06170 [Deltaproteobacteria bacterium DG_8]
MNILETKVLINGWYKILIIILSFTISDLTVDCYALDPPPITPVDEFFVENSNGIPPIPDDWQLTVEGAVATPLSLTLEDLMDYPAVTHMATLECMGNPFTPLILIGNANWTGVPLRTIIEETSPLSEAQSIAFHCLDGYIVQFSLYDMLQRNNDILAYSMNGEILPTEQGYPLRLVLPGNIGTTWAQWIERIEISETSPETNFFAIPLHAQIFTPQDGKTLTVGTHTIAGMAVVGEDREITKVEMSTDGGVTWEPAQLLSYFVPNVWKHWEFIWEVSQVGEYLIIARAEDGLGNKQNEEGFFSLENFSITVTIDYDNDEDEVPDSEDNCPYNFNPDQNDKDEDGIGDACDECTDIDGDGYGNPGFSNNTCNDDNCPDTPNGEELGTCVKTIAGIVVSYRVGEPKSFITCTSDADCLATGGTCQLEQGDCNDNGCGDACECYMDCNNSGAGDGKVAGTDLGVLKGEYGRFGCSPSNPCYADGNENGEVTGTDLSLLKNEYGRFDCPACP